jgi:rod shape determining protein RodA
MRKTDGILNNLDWLTVILFLLLVLMGWANIYAAVYDEEHANIFDLSQRYGKQLMWIGTSIILIGIIFILDGKIYQTLAIPIYIVSMLALLLVLFAGKEIAGARSWFAFGGFSIQPSEFAKFATALALASFLGKKDRNLKGLRDKLIGFVIIIIPAVLIIPQPDPGSALVYGSLLLVLYREGLSGAYIFIGLALALLFLMSLLIPLLSLQIALVSVAVLIIVLTRKSKGFWIKVLGLWIISALLVNTVDYAFNTILEDRHRNRINILLGKAHDPKGIGYNTAQSMIAIGSGGVIGKGYLNGTQTKFDFVPEQSTDFIFCTIGEEWGFVGSGVLIVLFLLLFFRLVQLAERQKNTFARAYGYAVVSILFFHFTINIAMTIGLAPVIGIPLPFFSYGGSSLWGFTLLLFIFLKLDSFRWESL